MMRTVPRPVILAALVGLALVAALAPSRMRAQAGRSPFDGLHFRDIGPAAAGGRIHDLEIDPRDPAILYVAAATGGIWKTTNKGVTWKPIFDGQADNTFGALAIHPRNPDIIW